MDKNGQWFSDSCDIQMQFVCFNATSNGKYIIIEVKKSWREAQEYCRTVHTDLANVRNSSENKDIKDIAKNDVWIGLFKDSWSWSDQSKSSFRFWNSSQLSNSRKDRDCVTVMLNQTGKWNDVQCNTTQPFICYGDLKSQSTTKQATPRPATATTKGNYTSKQPTQILTTGPEQATPRPATTNTEGNYTSTQPTQILTTGPEQATPRPATTNTEGKYTSTQPTQILTTGPEQDNLILVRENLTWSEAVTYCRKHHIDLVSIYSEEHQNKAARKVVEASTSHVWLGLRYTCTFNFWFWTKNREAGCYQNWASGHGPHGYEECGLSGAMESTGGHRWVGRPESERLNFICQICTNAF
ncbi:hypothetical protein QQF64_009799 [Cirrhinus molitorella]|uniref:C-type lectin domain-containing protein n=1 Tax=Cirrhinus molitorella TaxID=172907 RepID=A0ABR3M258_9TELE